MAKTVFGSHDQTAHVWAQGRGGDTGHGRSSDGRMFFDGRTLFSYGRHFALGLVIVAPISEGNPRGEVVATLLNSDGYSPSTGKHKSIAWRAARGRTLHVPKLTEIYRTLEDVTGPHARDHRALAKINLARYIAANHAGLSPDAAAYIWVLVGGTEKQAAAMLTKATKAAKAEAEKQARDDLARTLKRAAEFAAMPPAAFLQWVRDSLSSQRSYYAESTAARMLKDLRALHRAASKAGKVKHKAALWAHIGRLQAVPAVMTAKLAEKHQGRRAAVAIVRAYLENAKAAEPKHVNSATWRRIHDAAFIIAGFTDTAGTLCAEMRKLADHAMEQRAIVAAAETEEWRRVAALEEAEQKAEWLAGNTAARWHGRTEAGGAYLRAIHVEIDGLGAMTGTLQTSQGADVPLAHALKAFRFIKLCRDKGQAWQANGRTVPVGHFRIDRIAANGDFHAGCHFIEWGEVERLAKALGVEGLAGDESAVVEREHA